MRESDLVATMTVHYASDGEGTVVAGANTVAAAQDRVSASAQAMATATESAKRRQVSAAAAFDALARRMDPAARAFADLERNQTTFNRALAANSSIVDKAGQGLDVYAAKLKAAESAAHGLLVQQENMRRQQSNLTTDPAAMTGTIKGAPVSLNQITGSQLSNVNVREYAAQFEAAAAAMETAAHAKAMQIGQAFGASLNESLIAGVGKSARESASVFTAELDRLDEISNQKALQVGKNFGASLDASLIAGVGKSARDSASVFTAELDRLDDIARQRATQVGKNFQDSLNQSFGIGSSGKSARDSAAVFQEAAVAEDKMVDASNRLKAALNPLAAEEAKQVEWLGLMKQAQQAGIITAEQFAGAQQLSVTRLANLSQSLKTAGTAGRVMSGEMTNLGFQLNDVVTGLALGQSPFMILGQQGGQIIQIFANSKASIADFASSSMSWFTSLFTAGRVAFGGIAAVVGTAAYAMAAFATSQREAGQALIGVGARTGTTISQINAFAKDNATATGLSVDQARTVAVEFTKTGNIAVAGLKGVGDAVHGFSILTGQDATEATKTLAKAFSGDLVQGAQEISKTYGFLNSSTMAYIQTLVLQGDRSAAMQVILDAMSKDNQKAADSVGVLTKAWEAFGNVVSRVKNAIGSAGAPAPLEDQLKAAQDRRDAIQNSPSPLGANPGGYGLLNTGSLAAGGDKLKTAQLAEADKVIADLNKRLAEFTTDSAVKKLNQMSAAGDAVVKSVIPQIDQIDALKLKLKELRDAQNTPGVARSLGADDAAATAIENLIAKTQDAQAETARYNERVKEISQSWGEVSQSTALALQAAQNQLPVIEAVGGAAKMAAQYTADFKNAMDQGKSATDATALAASNLAASMAQVKAAAQEQLFALQNSLPVSQAWTASAQMRAQQQATFNQLLHDGVDAETAGAVAAAQYADAKAKAVSSADKLVQSSQDNLEKIKAQGTGMEAVVDSSIAYRNAIQSGATATQAAAIAADSLEASMIQAAQAAQRMEQSAIDAANGTVNGIVTATGTGSQFDPIYMPKGPLTFSADPNLNVHYANGGPGKRLDTGVIIRDLSSTMSPDSVSAEYVAKGDYAGAIKAIEAMQATAGGINRDGTPITGGIDVNNQMSQVDQLTQLLNAQTSDKGTQITNLQQELAWLNTLPETIARDQKIISLTQSIDQLKNSTDGLNGTMGDLLSPYYSQDPRTSHIGFRSQGMASGGEFTVPGGYSSNDNMVGQIPLSSGEIVSVRRPGESGGGGTTTIINMPMTFNGPVNKDEVLRTAYQAAQNGARQLRAANQ